MIAAKRAAIKIRGSLALNSSCDCGAPVSNDPFRFMQLDFNVATSTEPDHIEYKKASSVILSSRTVYSPSSVMRRRAPPLGVISMSNFTAN